LYRHGNELFQCLDLCRVSGPGLLTKCFLPSSSRASRKKASWEHILEVIKQLDTLMTLV